MDSGIKSQTCSLAELLARDVELKMPPYQRSYVWDVDEVGELLGDLRTAAAGRRHHFIGAIVLVDVDEYTSLVVDGQQRLTTLTMILAVLRDLETDEKLKTNLHALIGDRDRARRGDDRAWRMTLNHVDNPFFREAVQEEGATQRRDIETEESSNHNRFQTNLEWLEKQIKPMSSAERLSLFETIRDRVVVVRVTVPNRNEGNEVFRVLNTRGKAPNSHDIIKTEILQKADVPLEDANKYAREWLDYEAQLGGSGLNELLNIIRQLYSKAQKGKTSDFAKVVLSKVDAKTFLDKELPRYVDAYRTVLKGDPDLGDKSAAVKTALDHLRLIDHSLWKVPAVAYLYHNSHKEDEALKFFQLLERFAFVMMLHITDRTPRQKRYTKLTQTILAGKPLLDGKSVLHFSKDDQKKVRDRLSGRFGNFSQRRAIALRLNAALENGEAVSPEDDATVEHVLPRAVPEDSFWNTVWPNGPVQRELCETVGNFVIVPQHINRAADRKDFREKKKIFFEQGGRIFSLTEDLRNRQSWTAEDVRSRTEQLVDILMMVWFSDLDE
ncbi:DUF262 domain-containing protein [Henriciella pelagia]|jgi:hypothetical protein|uniref:DUF262 domain-containing protein n=1 Tax=Henriciella pelagia TaxID=1977912 RepID=A0ABQ1JGX7_9PROT|nr:DUF262 domain-containing protein [Henriciella pelagia]GGB66600.1 hypothetical protein GCM10011503_14220 [Henriciella pelagia]